MSGTYFFPPGSGDNPLFSLYLEPKYYRAQNEMYIEE